MKKCTKCKINKELDDFNKYAKSKDGFKTSCRSCDKEYRDKNKERLSQQRKSYYRKNREIEHSNKKLHYNKNKSKINARRRHTYKENGEITKITFNKYRSNRKLNDPLYKLKEVLRSRLNKAFKVKSWTKQGSTKLLGCDIQTAFNHIESLFQEGMTWNNHGKWHIDHKIPLASAKTKEELVILCHYTNLQPLWALDNILKSDKII